MRLIHNSLHDEVADGLRARIFEGLLAPGSFIDEAALCADLAISRTPLREALKVLAAEGLVRHEPRRGSFVSQVTEQDLDDIFPVIALLEGRCALEATRNATDADIAALETPAPEPAAARRSQTHHRLLRGQLPRSTKPSSLLANNRWLAQVIADLRKILKLARLQQLHAPGRLEQSLSEHLAVFAAIKARDGETADAAMRTHLLRQREALARTHPHPEKQVARMNQDSWINRNVARLLPKSSKEKVAEARGILPGAAPKNVANGSAATDAPAAPTKAAGAQRPPGSAWTPRCAMATRPCPRACCGAFCKSCTR